MMKHSTSQQRFKLIRRSLFVALVFGFILLYYLNSNQQQQPSEYSFEALPQRTSSNDSASRSTGHHQDNHRRKRPPSLIVRPLNELSDRAALFQNLKSEKILRLFHIANRSLFVDQDLTKCDLDSFWANHRLETYEQRNNRLSTVCQKYNFLNRVFTSWHMSTNRHRLVFNDDHDENDDRHYNHHHVLNASSSISNETEERTFCNTRACPLLVNAKHSLMTCFVQKIASTSIKQLFSFLDRSNVTTEDVVPVENLTEFHFKINQELHRISPMYLTRSKTEKYYKTIFIRHPFVRLVSAFKDKAERSPSEEPFFYQTYWWPLLERLHKNDHQSILISNNDKNRRVSFKQFVEHLLLKTDPYEWDEHWAPIWTRCEPCFIHYDFIGKLETADKDFKHFRSLINTNLVNVTVWQNYNKRFDRNDSQAKSITTTTTAMRKCNKKRFKYLETIRYLSQLSPETIQNLYKMYYLDFELFGYTFDELFKIVQ